RTFTVEGNASQLDLAHPIPMAAETSFDLASLTKIVATVGTLMATDSQWSLDDRVGKYLPQWNGSDKFEITIRHLLQHRSGLLPWLPLYIRHSEPESAHAFIANHPLENRVDEIRRYSDLGFITLGKIIESITGESIETAAKKYVFDSFGMKQTQFAKPLTPAASTSRGDRFEYEMVRTDTPYVVEEEVSEFSGWRKEILTGEINDGNSFHLFKGVSAHAGLFSTANDLIQFCESITPSLTFKKLISESRDEGAHIGFKSWNSEIGNCSTNFYGHTGFTGTALAISPEHGASLVLLTNRLHTDGEVPATEDLIQIALREFHAHLHG
ncbi:MAG: hypothetical protein RL414_66, partial [Actinomycetota bacterium]